MSRAGLFVPLGVFALILVVGFAGFQLADPHRLPSALIGKPFPEFSSTLLTPRGVGVDRSRLVGSPVLVNVWATWCPTCKAEHDELMRITETTNLRIVGVNYKDDPELAEVWLQEFGDPYEFNLMDLDGRLGVELGVYGAPESFLLDSEGTIVYKRVGEINQRIWQSELLPRLEAMEVLGGDV
jgi:cytochrome c biogenesis protein CcmG/thiol:disulfide interchange protein DsbE